MRIISALKKQIKYKLHYVDFAFLRKHPIKFIYYTYITLKYVDEWSILPAIRAKGKIKFQINKHKTSKLIIKDRLIFEAWISENEKTIIQLSHNSSLVIINEFIIGDSIRIHVATNAKLLLKGKKKESGSGITAKAVVLCYNYIEIGYDCIIAWDTFITDCDWHGVGDKASSKDTIIGDHVWIGVGAKVLKGCNLRGNNIITSNSVVLSGNYSPQTLISGNPATVNKSNIPNWCREMNTTG